MLFLLIGCKKKLIRAVEFTAVSGKQHPAFGFQAAP
jgi:hypothetical protein